MNALLKIFLQANVNFGWRPRFVWHLTHVEHGLVTWCGSLLLWHVLFGIALAPSAIAALGLVLGVFLLVSSPVTPWDVDDTNDGAAWLTLPAAFTMGLLCWLSTVTLSLAIVVFLATAWAGVSLWLNTLYRSRP